MKRFILTTILMVGILSAAMVTKTIAISPADLSFQKIDGYDVVILKGAVALREPGKPNLPQLSCHFLIPATAEVEKVELVDKLPVELNGTYNISPAHPCFPLSKPEEAKRVEPDQRIYSSSTPFPGELVELFPSGSMSGFRVAGVLFNPIQYIPNQGKLILYKEVTVRLHYQEGVHQSSILTQRQFDVIRPVIESMVLNPEDIDLFRPQVRTDAIDDVNYAIITDAGLVSDFADFKDWKTKKGYNCDVFTTDWIYSNYPGSDNQEEIRNFLKDYYASKGLIYALLAGDYHLVPDRDAYSSYYSPYYLASDWYFGDLDGDWDGNNNNRYGERSGDGIDGYFDIFVGRAPVDGSSHIATFTDKVLTHEKNPPSAHIRKLLLPSVQLFSNGWHGRMVNNQIADSSPGGWFDAKLEDPTRYATRDSLQRGYQMCHIAAHGSESGFWTMGGSPIFMIDDVNQLTNGDSLTIMWTIACHTGYFDSPDCIAEVLVNKDGGGCVADIMNSRYGFGSWSGFGPSEYIDMKFAGHFFNRDVFNIGETYAAAKHSYHSYFWNPGQGVWHYCGVEFNLFGDPNLPMHENVPVAMTADHPDQIDPGSQNYTVTVTDGKAPVEDALVCCYKEDEVHKTGSTNSSGQVTLSINPQTNGTMYVTATAKDHTPYEGTCQVGTPGVEEETAQSGRTMLTSISNNPGSNFLIGYSIGHPTTIRVSLYDINGRLVRNIADETVESGHYTLRIDGAKLQAGIYFLRFEADDYQRTEKLILVK